MIKIKLLCLLHILAFLFSCDTSDPDLSTFELSKTEFLNVSNEGDLLTVSITGDATWTVSSDALWCKLNTKKGEGEYELILSIDVNIDDTERTATVFVQVGSTSKTIKVYQQANATSAEHAYKIPVIFHVLYKDKADRFQYIEEGRLAEVLNVVNRLYNDESKSVDMNLEFALAETYPKTGKALSEAGVNRLPWETANMDSEEFMQNNEGLYSPLLWDPNDYINVFVYNFTNDNSGSTILGISHLPYTTASHFLEGTTETKHEQLALENLSYPYSLSINSLFIYEQSGSGIYNPRDISVTLAHELGHYLGLLHAFSEGEEGEFDFCADTDYCPDTPTYNRNQYDDYLNTLIQSGSYQLEDLTKRTDCAGKIFTSYNIMDYVYSYTDRFTPDQRERIRHVLNYSPLIPGPKKGRTKAGYTPKGILDLPIRTIK